MNLKTDDTFEDILSIAKKTFHHAVFQDDCLPKELLFDYVAGGLSDGEHDLVLKHTDACEKCRAELMKMEADHIEWEMRLSVQPEKALFLALSSEGVRLVLQSLKRKERPVRSALENISDAVIRWASPIWKPVWAGETVTADDIPVQEQTFPTDEGNLEIACSWEGKYEDDPAYIRLNWKVRMTAESELWVRFLDPQTERILFEGRLGEETSGQEDFTSDELGFDPSSQKWALSIIILEKNA